jgi:hypothetical protein
MTSPCVEKGHLKAFFWSLWAGAVKRRKERKQFCAFSARRRFHTALYEDFRVKCYCNSMSFVVRGSV